MDPSLLPELPLVCSIGIGSDASFDRELVRNFRATVIAFDPTPGSAEAAAVAGLTSPKFTLYPFALANFDGPGLFHQVFRRGRRTACWTLHRQGDGMDSGLDAMTVQVVSIGKALSDLVRQVPDVLKIDAEGSEYGILDDMVRSRTFPPQLLVEFHHGMIGAHPNHTLRAIESLRRAGYLLAYVSDLGCEYTFLHRDAIDASR